MPKDERLNAFNQKNEKEYLYQATDIKIIQSHLLRSYEDVVFLHEPFGDKNVHLIKNLIVNANSKADLLAYNLGNLHWIALMILKINGRIEVLLKDLKIIDKMGLQKGFQELLEKFR